MIKIETPEKFKEIISGFRKQGYKLSNCFFLPDTVKEKTTAGSLYFRQLTDGALILDDQGAFFRCYYYLPEEGEPEHICLDKDAVIEFPYNGEMNEKQLRQVGKIESLGFILGRKSGVMTAAPGEIIHGCGSESMVQYADAQDAMQISELLKENFNPLYAFLPGEEELEEMISALRVFIIRGNERIKAVLVSDFSKGTASIRQVAVAKQEREKGFGKLLLESYHNKYRPDAVMFQHWVDLDNKPAIHMYQSFGYRFSLRKANEYILLSKGGI